MYRYSPRCDGPIDLIKRLDVKINIFVISNLLNNMCMVLYKLYSSKNLIAKNVRGEMLLDS